MMRMKATGGCILATLLALLLLCLNVLQALSLLLYPVCPVLARRFNRELANVWWGLCVQLGTEILKYEVIVTGDNVPPGENALVFSNHQEMPDVFVLMTFARRKGRLGDLKFFVKDVLKWIPGMGWGMWMLDCVFLKRTWADDETRIRATFHKFTTYQIPFWLAFFPEGTRIRPEKSKLSQEYAREKGLPLLDRVMIPRTKGFTAAMTGLRSRADAVYDLTIRYEGTVPTLADLVTGKAKRTYLHVKRFSVNELPTKETELARWLLERFVEKNKLLSQYPATW